MWLESVLLSGVQFAMDVGEQSQTYQFVYEIEQPFIVYNDEIIAQQATKTLTNLFNRIINKQNQNKLNKNIVTIDEWYVAGDGGVQVP